MPDPRCKLLNSLREMPYAEYMEKYVGSYKRGIWACDGRRHHQGDKEERRDKNRLTRHKISDITFKT